MTQNTHFPLVMAVSMRFRRTEREAFWIPQWLGGQGSEGERSTNIPKNVPSPGALELTKSIAKALEMLDLPLPEAYPCDSAE